MLKLCKCGEPAEIRGEGVAAAIYDEQGNEQYMGWTFFDGYKVQCSDCFEETNLFSKIEDAVEAWNDKW